MEEKYLQAFAECIRIAVDKDYASDIIEFDLDGDWDGFEVAFKSFFKTDLYPNWD